MELYGQWTIWNPVFQVTSETPVGRHASFNSPVQFTEDTNSSTPYIKTLNQQNKSQAISNKILILNS